MSHHLAGSRPSVLTISAIMSSGSYAKVSKSGRSPTASYRTTPRVYTSAAVGMVMGSLKKSSGREYRAGV
jgi:hypothetical protein